MEAGGEKTRLRPPTINAGSPSYSKVVNGTKYSIYEPGPSQTPASTKVGGLGEGERKFAGGRLLDPHIEGSLEILVSSDLFALYRDWLYQQLISGRVLTKMEAIYEPVMMLKDLRGYGSSQTTRRYLKELTMNPDYPFKMDWDPMKGWIVVLRKLQ